MRFVVIVLLGLVLFSTSAQEHLLTHSTDFARVDPSSWVVEGWRVPNPDQLAVAVKTEDGAGIGLAVVTPNSAMAWTMTFEPIWTEPFSTLALSYFVDGVPAEGGAFIELFDGSTGPITPGATNTENPLASGGRVSCGSLTPGLHVELVDLSAVEKLDRVAEITITVRSGAEPVAVRLNQIAFFATSTARRPTPPAEEDGRKLGFLRDVGATWYSLGFGQLTPDFYELLTRDTDHIRLENVPQQGVGAVLVE